MGKVETGSARRGASRAAGRSTLWRSLADDFALRRDGTEARMAVLQQVMLAVVVLVITAFAIIAAIPGDLTLFFVGVAMVFVMTIVTMLVPWNAISPWAVGIVPVIDVVAILNGLRAGLAGRNGAGRPGRPARRAVTAPPA